jgi:ferredoxin
MDAQRFDDLARALGRRTSRRAVLRGAAGGTVAGALVRTGVRPAVAQGTCDEGLTECDGVCVDLSSDLNNCGACGSVCPTGLVGVACYQGECVRTSCPAALPDYCYPDDPNPTFDHHCFDLTTDPNNCGSCGNVCASGECIDGTCTPTLPETGSGSAVERPGDGWATAALAAVAVLGAAVVRKAFSRRARDDR